MSAELVDDIAGLVDAIVKPLVEFPDEVEISSGESEDGTVNVEIKANPDDTGKIIGRQGRVIKSIRTLVRAVASRDNVDCEVEILD